MPNRQSTKSIETIAVTSTSFSQSDLLIKELGSLGAQIHANREGRKLSGKSLIEFIGSAEIAVIGVEPVTKDVLKACPGLKFIAKYGVGTDNLDLNAMAELGVELGWTGGVNRRSVAELVLGFALGHLRNIVPTGRLLAQGKWQKQGGRQLSGVRFGIVGFGNIGTEVARLLNGLGLPAAQILFCDVIDRSEVAATLGATAATYSQILATCDVISFHVPLTGQTRQMYGLSQIPTTKSDALIINTSRGDVIDFDAVVDAVKKGRLGGYAADVFPEEPFDASPFASDLNLYFTPHIGGNAAEAVLAMGRSAVSHVANYLGQHQPQK